MFVVQYFNCIHDRNMFVNSMYRGKKGDAMIEKAKLLLAREM